MFEIWVSDKRLNRRLLYYCREITCEIFSMDTETTILALWNIILRVQDIASSNILGDLKIN